eukprot:3760004-Amphidinium_carterae.1
MLTVGGHALAATMSSSKARPCNASTGVVLSGVSLLLQAAAAGMFASLASSDEEDAQEHRAEQPKKQNSRAENDSSSHSFPYSCS